MSEYENDKERYEADIRRMVEGIDIESLRKLSVQELMMRNALLHKVNQYAIISNDPRREGLIAQQRAVNAVLVEKKSRGKKKVDPAKIQLKTIEFNLTTKK